MAGFREARGDLQLESVTKTFGDFTAVDDIDLTVPRGSFFALLGPVGLRQDHDAAHGGRARAAHRAVA